MLLLIAVGNRATLFAASFTWDGGGANNNWNTAANWNPDGVPAANDSLSFDGVIRTTSNNNLPAATQFNGLTFNSTAGAFTLGGNSITLHGDITDNRQVRPETINNNLALDGPRNVNVADGGSVIVNGAISGPTFGITKIGLGTLSLLGSNSFSGPLTINTGKVIVNSGASLGGGNSVLLNSGTLSSSGATDPLMISAIIAVGPTVGNGFGSIEVLSNDTVVVHSITNNGAGNGGLIKTGFGTLQLDGVNTYTGPTIVEQSRILLDFTGSGGPTANLISSGSALTLQSSATGDRATRSYSTIRMEGDAASPTSQTFASTLVDVGAARVLVYNAAAVATTLNLAALTHNAGGIAVFATSSTSHVITSSPNVNGILGGWATMGTITSSSVVTDSDIARGTSWSSVDGGGNIVPYVFQANETYATGQVLHTSAPFLATNRNLQVTTGSTGNITVDTAGAGTTTDVNTIEIAPSTTNLNGRAIEIGANNTLRFGRNGGLFRADFSTNNAIWTLGTPNAQDVGTVTAGGAPDTAGELVFTVNAPAEVSAGTLNVEAKITDNGAGAVTVVKAGAGSMKLRGNNTYSGGTYIVQGRVQLAGTEIGSPNPGGLGSGPVTVLQGGQIFFSGPNGFGGGTVTNDLRIAGSGLDDEATGVIRMVGGVNLAGTITLLNDSRIAGGEQQGSTISGRITGPHNLTFGTNSFLTTQITLSNPLNDWTGNTTLLGRNSAQDYVLFVLGANEVIPDGYNKGDLILQGSGTPGAGSTFVMNGFSETVNGLVSSGTIVSGNVSIVNDQPNTTSLLTVGNSDQTAAFAGIILDSNNPNEGIVAFKKIGLGTQTLSGANKYSGTTEVSAGTLLINGSHTGAGNYTVDVGATLGGTGSIAFVGGSSLSVSGTLSPGASIESLDVTGNASFDTTSSLLIELDGTSNLIDLFNVNGDISVINGAIAQFLVTGTPTLPQYVFGTYTGTLSGLFSSSTVPSGYSLVQGGGLLRLVQVPEPSTLLLAVFGIIGVFCLVWCRSS